MSRIIHFEIQATDPGKLVDFYTELLGWKFTNWGEADYWLIETGPEGTTGINGGLLRRSSPPVQSGQGVNAFVCTAEVDKLDEALETAATLGASVAVPKMEVPGIGWVAYVVDPDGNLMGLLEPLPEAERAM